MTHKEIETLVDAMIAEGTEHTNYGSWCFYFDEIGDEAVEAVDEIVDELYKREEVCDVDVCEDCIDVNFYTGYCPYVADEEEEKMETRIGLAKKGTIDNKIARRNSPFDGIEEYLYYRVSDTKIAKVPDILGDDSLWKEAECNTFADTKVATLRQVMADILGIDAPSDDGTDEQYVITTTSGMLGAAAILDTQTLVRELGHGTFVMLPSSIHEVLLIPADENTDIAVLTEMVQKVNATEVLPSEQLGDKAYVITL